MVDTGLDYFHPDLAQNLWRNPKEIPNNGKDDDNNGATMLQLNGTITCGPACCNAHSGAAEGNSHAKHCNSLLNALAEARCFRIAPTD